MRRTYDLAIRPVAVALLALGATGETFVVDDDGGPGVDFTDLPAAVGSADNGDLLLVQAGTYSSFTVDGKRLTIVGQGGPIIDGAVAVQNLGVKRCELLSLTMTSLALQNCAGPVFLDGLTIVETALHFSPYLMDVDQCVDVRIRDSFVSAHTGFWVGSGAGALRVNASRVEASSSTFLAAAGTAGLGGVLAGDGGPGAVLTNGSELHLAGSSVGGNEGGLTFCENGCLPKANGGIGLEVDATSSAIVAGDPSHFVSGGLWGGTMCCVGNGSSGLPWINAGELRLSGVGMFGPYPIVGKQDGVNTGTLTEPMPNDPWLEVVGTPTNGSFDTVLRIWGSPGDAARINLGRTPILVETPGVAVGILVAKLRTINLGFIPPTGYVDYAWPQLGFFSTGTPFLAQAITVLPTGEVRRTNSAPIVVR